MKKFYTLVFLLVSCYIFAQTTITPVPSNAAPVVIPPIPVINQGTTNATALTAFTATFSTAFSDTNYTAISIGDGIALAASFVSAKTTTNCIFNMTAATGLIEWIAIHK